jgi:hypothetical protein
MAQSGGPGMSASAVNKGRGSKVARRAFSYRGAGKVRRRIRRLVRSLFFNNTRTATLNLDLPLAIALPISSHLLLLHRRILASAWRPQWWAFFGIRRCAGGRFFNGAATFGQGADMSEHAQGCTTVSVLIRTTADV